MSKQRINIRDWLLRLLIIYLAFNLWMVLVAWPHPRGKGIWPMNWPIPTLIPGLPYHMGRCDLALGFPFYFGFTQNDVASRHPYNISGDWNRKNYICAWIFWGMVVWGNVLGWMYYAYRRRHADTTNNNRNKPQSLMR